MLQAFIDDSVQHNGPPVFSLAGFISTPERWARFDNEWQKVLDMPLRLDYLKMSEAMSFRGQFDGFSEERRNERLQLFDDCISEHCIAGVAFVLPHDVYREVFDHPGVPDYLKYPYHVLLQGLIIQLNDHKAQLGLTEKVDFIFDTQTEQEIPVYQAWQMAKAKGKHLDLLGDSPVFKSELEQLPLQAADMCAWVVRKRWESIFDWRTKAERAAGVPRQPEWRAPWKHKKLVPVLQFHWTEKEMLNLFGDILAQTGKFSFKMTFY